MYSFASSSTIVFVGIPTTLESLVVGYVSHKYRSEIMEAFRKAMQPVSPPKAKAPSKEGNAQPPKKKKVKRPEKAKFQTDRVTRSQSRTGTEPQTSLEVKPSRSIWLPEELICRIETYVKLDGDELGRKKLANIQDNIKRYGHCGHFEDVLDWNCGKYLKKEFNTVYIISGNVKGEMNSGDRNASDDCNEEDDEGPTICCGVTHGFICVSGTATAINNSAPYVETEDPEDDPKVCKRSKKYSNCVVDQNDVSITMEKSLVLNKVIREFDLKVHSDTISVWPSTVSDEHGKLWTPQVVLANVTTNDT